MKREEVPVDPRPEGDPQRTVIRYRAQGRLHTAAQAFIFQKTRSRKHIVSEIYFPLKLTVYAL